MESSRSIAATVDFPMPMEPVSPSASAGRRARESIARAQTEREFEFEIKRESRMGANEAMASRGMRAAPPRSRLRSLEPLATIFYSINAECFIANYFSRAFARLTSWRTPNRYLRRSAP